MQSSAIASPRPRCTASFATWPDIFGKRLASNLVVVLQDFHARFQRTGKPYRKLDGNWVSEDSLQVCEGTLAFVVIIGPKCQFLACRLLDNLPGITLVCPILPTTIHSVPAYLHLRSRTQVRALEP